MTTMKDAALITAYLLHAATSTRDGTDAEQLAASDELQELVWNDPERAWPVICEVIRRASADDVLAYVAAGPLEDLLVHHPHAFIDRVESLAKEDAHFRWAVSGVWGWNSIPDDVRRRLDKVLGDETRL
jgi:hypothetical protein